MRIVQIDANKPFKIEKPICACIGYFDGLHLGHQSLIKATVDYANKHHLEPALITFDPDPAVILHKQHLVKHLTPMKQRMHLAHQFGIKNIIILRFTPTMANLSGEKFVTDILNQANIQKLICGFDFRYGFKGEGNIDTLKRLGHFELQVIEQVSHLDEKISTTKIKHYIQQGHIEKANALLGQSYTVYGQVIKGKQLGRTIGFPTANVQVENEYILPKEGVYACYVYVKNKPYKGVCNIGYNPTFNYSNAISVEVHIIDFNQDLYQQQIGISFVKFLRYEKQFKNIDNLILQLEQDVYCVKKELI